MGNETKHTSLPWKVVDEYQTEDCNIIYHAAIRDANDKLVLAIQQVTFDADEQMRAIREAVVAVNAGPKVKELMKAARLAVGEFVEMSEGRIEFTPKSIQQLSKAAHEVEATLKGETDG